MQGDTPAVRRGLAAALAAAAGALLTTAASLDAWFVGDDLGEIHRAAHGDPRGAHARPLVTVMLRLNRAVGGLDPLGYHVLNVVLHAAVILAVGWSAAGLARRWEVAPHRARWIGPVAGAAFALSATHSEAVSWISARGDLVVAAGALVAVGAWARRDGRRRWVGVAVVGVAAALAAKEHAVAVPFLCLVVGVGPAPLSARRARDAAREALPLFAVLVAYLALRALVLGALVGSYEGSGAFDWRAWVVAGRLATMGLRTLVPGSEPWVLVGAAVALGAAAAAWWAVSTRRPGARADRALGGSILVMTGVALAPAGGLGVSLDDVRGDRLLYLGSGFACIGIAVVVVGLVDAAPAGVARSVAVALSVAAMGLSARAAVERDGRWAEAGTLSEATMARGPVWDRERPVVVVNPIDTVGGAYAHRNELGDAAVVVHGWSSPSLVAGLAPMAVADAGARVEVRPLGARRWRLVPDPDTARFDPSAPPAQQADGIAVRRHGDAAIDVTVEPEVDLGDVWVVTEGRLVPLGAVG